MTSMVNNPENVLDITGPEHESLFWHLKEWLFSQERVPEVQKRLDELWNHYRDVTDDRLLALVAGLCIESSVDLLLIAFAPAFGQYRDDIDFTFSIKIKMARSMQLLPARILTSCDLVRQMRNEFAHHLDYNTFDRLASKHLDKLHPQVRSYIHTDQDAHDYTILFRTLTGVTLAALQVYTLQLSDLRMFIDHDFSRNVFKEWILEQRKST